MKPTESAQAAPGDILEEPPITIDPRVAGEIKRLKDQGQQGLFRISVIPDASGDNLVFEMTWDEPNREDFGLKLPLDQTIIIDGMTLAFMFDSYDVVYVDNKITIAKKGERTAVGTITPDDVNGVIAGERDLAAELNQQWGVKL